MERDYRYLTATMSFCEQCETLVQAKLVERDGQVFLRKDCPEHGIREELYEEDAAWHARKARYDKPGTSTPPETAVDRGCPYDCGLCPSHDQHTCIALVEVTNACDLGCPTCFAKSGEGEPLSLETIERMLRHYWQAEGGEAEVVQISGGEPTTHPQILEIIRMARGIGFPMVMLNTNGLRIAADDAFADALQEFSTGGFEVYLQYDGGCDAVYEKLRGRPLAAEKRKAIAQLTRRNIPLTLVTTVASGINDHLLGEILTLAMRTDCVRGLSLQPLARFGRLPDEPSAPVTLSGVLRRIEQQSGGLITMDDFVPLPCNVERVAITYLLKQGGSFLPITRKGNLEAFAPEIENTFLFTAENLLKRAKASVSLLGGCKCLDFLREFKNALPSDFLLQSPEQKKQYIDQSTFRISVQSFVDMRSFDLKSMQKECIHILTPDCRRIPFSAFNMLHREGRV